MAMVRRKLRVTHLVDEDPTLDARGQAALNQDPVAQRLVKPVASVQTCEVGGAPHRARGDAAVEKLAIQIIKKAFEAGPSPVMEHSRAVTILTDVPNKLFSALARVGLAARGPILLHSAADLSFLRGGHRLTTTSRPVG
jgi:hypothetical protein